MERIQPIYLQQPNQSSAIPDDLEVHRGQGSPLRILGSGGATRELAAVPAEIKGIPVLLGAGMGHALQKLLAEHKRVVLLDREEDILEAACLGQLLQHPRLFHIRASNSEDALKILTQWQMQVAGGAALSPVAHPFYLRLDKAYYGFLREQVQASNDFDFWSKARKPRFASSEPRILLITSRYFLIGEVAEACQRLNIPHRLLTVPDDKMASSEFISQLLQAVVEFQPDMALTLNHLGVDREGLLTNLLERLQLPLASWFVDNPHLVLHVYEGLSSPWVTLFTWDSDNIPSLQAQGFEHVFYLPLGTDPVRFHPKNPLLDKSLKARVSFVGNSMVYKVGQKLKKNSFPKELLTGYGKIAQSFCQSQERSIKDFLFQVDESKALAYTKLPDKESRLAYEALLTWEATRQYRSDCVAQLMEFAPLIVGDDGWKRTFRKQVFPWRWHSTLTYYTELPSFYGLSEVNFNTTSMQMKGAVNQRIFDVPAAGAFVLTDWHEQMDTLFDPGTEMASYRHVEEIPGLVRYYLEHPRQREKITLAARKRVLAEHTWDQRVLQLLRVMRQVYGTPL